MNPSRSSAEADRPMLRREVTPEAEQRREHGGGKPADDDGLRDRVFEEHFVHGTRIF